VSTRTSRYSSFFAQWPVKWLKEYPRISIVLNWILTVDWCLSRSCRSRWIRHGDGVARNPGRGWLYVERSQDLRGREARDDISSKRDAEDCHLLVGRAAQSGQVRKIVEWASGIRVAFVARGLRSREICRDAESTKWIRQVYISESFVDFVFTHFHNIYIPVYIYSYLPLFSDYISLYIRKYVWWKQAFDFALKKNTCQCLVLSICQGWFLIKLK